MTAFLGTCCVVLLNILIAQLSDTYQNVQSDAHRGLELNRAWIITRVELHSIYHDRFRKVRVTSGGQTYTLYTHTHTHTHARAPINVVT